MRRHDANGLVYYTFDSLNDIQGLVHAVSTRRGGVSPPPFDTLNLSINIGDAPANVAANTRRLHHALGLDETMTVTARQVQADQIAVVYARHKGAYIQGVDALLTNEPGVTLLLRYADCVPIMLYDPVHRAIGIVHAGWRGAIAKIAAKSVEAMQQAFGTRAQDIIACIGPSIGPCCYEIGDKVIAKVRAAFDQPDGLLLRLNGSTRFDLWQANAQQMRQAGVEQIEISGMCTADRTSDFYSWRAEDKKTGRFGALIGITK